MGSELSNLDRLVRTSKATGSKIRKGPEPREKGWTGVVHKWLGLRL